MQKFIAKLLLLSFSFLAFYGFPSIVLLLGKELVSVQQVEATQRAMSNLVLYGPAYCSKTLRYKLSAVLARSPEVIALGTSRVMQFRSRFFKNSRGFYNAGGGILQIADLPAFLEKIPQGHEPKFVILGLDPWLFNPNWKPERAITLADDPTSLDILLDQSLRIYQDYGAGKFLLTDLLMHENTEYIGVGINALTKKNGFRNDGSYYYGGYIADPLNTEYPDFEFRATLKHIENGEEWFAYGNEVSKQSLGELEKFLQESKLRGVYVVGFLPPYPHQTYSKMLSMPDKYGYITMIYPTIALQFHKYGYPLFDFSDLVSIGSSDVETVDGFHASEKAYLRLFLLMMKQDQPLTQIAADEKFLRSRLEASNSPYIVFGNDEY